jgi:hypothetical protein
MRDAAAKRDGGSARETWYRQSHDDPRRPESAMAGRPQRDAVGGDAGRIMDPLCGGGMSGLTPAPTMRAGFRRVLSLANATISRLNVGGIAGSCGMHALASDSTITLCVRSNLTFM